MSKVTAKFHNYIISNFTKPLLAKSNNTKNKINFVDFMKKETKNSFIFCQKFIPLSVGFISQYSNDCLFVVVFIIIITYY